VGSLRINRDNLEGRRGPTKGYRENKSGEDCEAILKPVSQDSRAHFLY
jgi:hypothetical protein